MLLYYHHHHRYSDSGTPNNGHCRGICFIRYRGRSLAGGSLSDEFYDYVLITIRSGWRDTPGSPSQPPSPLELLSGPLHSSLSLSQIGLDNWSAPVTSVSLAEPHCYYEWNSTEQKYVICRTVHINISEKWNVIVRIMSCVGAVLECQRGVCIAAYHRLSSTGREL
jgi:hypothetical protein